MVRFEPRRELGRTGFVRRVSASAIWPIAPCRWSSASPPCGGRWTPGSTSSTRRRLRGRLQRGDRRPRAEGAAGGHVRDRQDRPPRRAGARRWTPASSGWGWDGVDLFVFHAFRRSGLAACRARAAGWNSSRGIGRGQGAFRGHLQPPPGRAARRHRVGPCDVVLFPIGPFVDRALRRPRSCRWPGARRRHGLLQDLRRGQAAGRHRRLQPPAAGAAARQVQLRRRRRRRRAAAAAPGRRGVRPLHADAATRTWRCWA